METLVVKKKIKHLNQSMKVDLKKFFQSLGRADNWRGILRF